MATAAQTPPAMESILIPDDLREFLKLRETDTDYVVQTLSGATLLRPKSEILYPWQLLQGIWDNGSDTTQQRQNEREWELKHDERRSGIER